MKTKLPLIAAIYCGMIITGSAFSLNFSSVAAGTSPTFTVNVPGYGNVQFDPVAGTTVVGNDFALSPSLVFNNNESVKITFLSLEPTDVSFSYTGVNGTESFSNVIGANNNEYIVTLTGAGASGSAGLFQVEFDQVPEPSTSFLGLIGGTLLVLRRRR